MIILAGTVSGAKFAINPASPLSEVLTCQRRPIPQVDTRVYYGDGPSHRITVITKKGADGYKFQFVLTGCPSSDTVNAITQSMLSTFFDGVTTRPTMTPTNSHRVLNLRHGIQIDVNVLRKYVRAHPEQGVAIQECARPRRIGASIIYIYMSQYGQKNKNVAVIISSRTVKIIGVKIPGPYTGFVRRYLCETGAVMSSDGSACVDHRIAFMAHDEYRYNIHHTALVEHIRKNVPYQQAAVRTRGSAAKRTVSEAIKKAYNRN